MAETAVAAKSTTKPAKKTGKTEAKTTAKHRFVGWQKTPIHQATYGRTTDGGSHNIDFELIHSTGSIQKTRAEWYLIDASQAPIGRIATTISTLLMGKHKPIFTPGAGSGDLVIVINADKAYFTSDKEDKKVYFWHSGYMGGLKSEVAKKALARRPDEVIWMAVQGMLPKNKISRYQLSHLKIYSGAEHPHLAQKPIKIEVAKNPLKKLGVQ